MSLTLNLIGVRIEKTEVYQGKNYTVVAAPAPDAFSYPSRFRLTSEKPIGNVGNFMDIDCTIRGVVRPKTFLDRNTGQQRSYDESDVYFEVFAARHHEPVSSEPIKTVLPAGVKSSLAP